MHSAVLGSFAIDPCLLCDIEFDYVQCSLWPAKIHKIRSSLTMNLSILGTGQHIMPTFESIPNPSSHECWSCHPIGSNWYWPGRSFETDGHGPGLSELLYARHRGSESKALFVEGSIEAPALRSRGTFYRRVMMAPAQG